MASIQTVTNRTVVLQVPEMDCPVEVGEIETALKDNPLIADKHFDVVNRTVTLVLTDANADTAGIFAVFKAIGMSAVEVKTAGACRGEYGKRRGCESRARCDRA